MSRGQLPADQLVVLRPEGLEVVVLEPCQRQTRQANDPHHETDKAGSRINRIGLGCIIELTVENLEAPPEQYCSGRQQDDRHAQ